MYTVEQISDTLDTKTFNPIPSLLRQLPLPNSQKSHPDIRQDLEEKVRSDEAALFVARREFQDSSHTVGLAGVELQEVDGQPTAVVTELAVDSRSRGRRLGQWLLGSAILWGSSHGARRVQVEVVPQPNSPGEALLQEMGFVRHDGLPVLELSDDQPK